MKSIKIGDTKYMVSEDLGYVQGVRCRVVMVMVAGTERAAVKRGGVWSLRPYMEKLDLSTIKKPEDAE